MSVKCFNERMVVDRVFCKRETRGSNFVYSGRIIKKNVLTIIVSSFFAKYSIVSNCQGYDGYLKI